MNEFDEECLNVFLENQSQLFEEAVAETLEDAEAFLEDCMAVVVENIDEVKEFLEEEGSAADHLYHACTGRRRNGYSGNV